MITCRRRRGNKFITLQICQFEVFATLHKDLKELIAYTERFFASIIVFVSIAYASHSRFLEAMDNWTSWGILCWSTYMLLQSLFDVPLTLGCFVSVKFQWAPLDHGLLSSQLLYGSHSEANTCAVCNQKNKTVKVHGDRVHEFNSCQIIGSHPYSKSILKQALGNCLILSLIPHPKLLKPEQCKFYLLCYSCDSATSALEAKLAKEYASAKNEPNYSTTPGKILSYQADLLRAYTYRSLCYNHNMFHFFVSNNCACGSICELLDGFLIG